MSTKQEEFYKELLADFKVEAAEHYSTITNGIINLEKHYSSNPKEVIEVVFRAVHSLKGAAHAVSHPDIEKLCQSFETVISRVKQSGLALSVNLFDVLQKAISVLDLLIRDIGITQKTYDPGLLDQSVVTLDQFTNEVNPSAIYVPVQDYTNIKAGSEANLILDLQNKEAIPEEKTAIQEMVKISTDKLTKLLLQAEELITSKETFKNHTHEIKILAHVYESMVKSNEDNLKVFINDYLKDNSHATEYIRSLKELTKKFRQLIFQLTKNAENIQRNISRTVDDMLIDIRKTLLVPFSSRIGMFSKMVRDLAREQKKEVNFIVEGDELEIDRNVLEQLKDPLIHILRNAIDHGIELPFRRIQKGKLSEGMLRLTLALTDNNQVMITITDDGEGISPDKVMASAIREGVVTVDSAAKLSKKEKIALIFRSGVSTSNYITNISGRGLGMAIVAEKVSGLGGTIEIESEMEKGTRIIIYVPLTLTTFRGVLISVGGQTLMVPINVIERVIRLSNNDIYEINGQESINIDGTPVGLLRLSDVLGIEQKNDGERRNRYHALILTSAKNRLVFIVDKVISEQEGIVKPMGSQLKAIHKITGVNVLGNGQVVPVLNATEILDTAVKFKSGKLTADELTHLDTITEEKNKKRKILVVEDSLTSRSLLRNLLEASGYEVQTSIDGIEALALLSSGHFDLVLSDIEMPRLNGFELTEKIRNDETLRSTPIVLITSLESKEDRQRGLDVGANAYFNKSSFDQTNLMEVISRLI